MSGSVGSYQVSRGPLLAQLSALATRAKEGTSAILTKDAQSGQKKSKEYFYIRGAGMPRSENIAMSRSTLVQVSSLAMHSEEEGTLCQYGSLKSEDDFIMIDKGHKHENEQPLTIEMASINTSICIDSVQPLTSSVEAQDKRNDTGQSSHPIPLSTIQQLFLQHRDTARHTLCSKLKTKGFKATFRFQQREVDIESRRVKGHGKALDVIASSVVEMELTFSSDELEQMAQVADKQVVVPQLSIDLDVLVVIDKTNGSMKLVGMADTINVLKETLNNLREMLDTSHKKNQEEQGSPSTSTSILRDNRPPETSAQKHAPLYQSMTNVPKEEIPATISDLLDNTTSIQRDQEPQGTLTQEQPSLHPKVDVPKKEDSASRVATELLPVDEGHLRYLCLHKWDEIQRIEKEEDVTISDSEHGYEVKGHAVAVMWATQKLRDLVAKVKCSTFSFETGVDVRKFAETVVNIGKTHKCLIGNKPNVRTVYSRPRAQSEVPWGSPVLTSFTQGDQVVKVTVLFNRMEKQNADVIVNITNRRLNLSSGFGLSYNLLKAAGSDIQTALRHTYPNGIDHGDLAVGRSGNLDTCKKIYHGCLPFFRGVGESFAPPKCYEFLASLVFRCLIQACKDGFQTIALPAFGTGALQYPTKNVVQIMYHAIDLFTQDKRQKSLKEIFIVTALESRLDVKQLFLAHRITQELKTRWLEAPPEDRRGFLYRLFSRRADSSLPVFLEREVRRPVQTKCELRIKIADTLVQIINGGIREVCDVTQASLLLWRERDTRTTNDMSRVISRRIIRAYGEGNKEVNVKEALLKGLRLAAEKEWYHVAIPLSAEDVLSPDQIAAAIVAAVKRRSSDVYVLTLAVPDTNIYIDIAIRIARHGTVQEPPDVSNVSLVDSLWKAKFSRQRSESLGETLAATMVVTSDSEETNTNAARDMEWVLHGELDVV